MHKLNPTYIQIETKQRLYQCPVPIVAITGSIATGKSSVSKILVERNYPVIDADRLIKNIYKKQEIIDFISTRCPKAFKGSAIDFKVLRVEFFNDDSLKNSLENLLYQYLEVEFRLEADRAIKGGANFIFYDVPLLFEKGLFDKVDLVVTVYTPKKLQLKRLKRRDNINQELALKLLESQIDIEEKKKQSHLIINNQSTLANLEEEVSSFLDILQKN